MALAFKLSSLSHTPSMSPLLGKIKGKDQVAECLHHVSFSMGWFSHGDSHRNTAVNHIRAPLEEHTHPDFIRVIRVVHWLAEVAVICCPCCKEEL